VVHFLAAGPYIASQVLDQRDCLLEINISGLDSTPWLGAEKTRLIGSDRPQVPILAVQRE
jgi:hypothetical protein